jgi:hypothetical protein
MAMDPAHDTALNDLIHELCDLGSVRLSERQLLRYYQAKNLSKAIWRDLERRFDDETEARNGNGEDWKGYWITALRAHAGVTLVAQQPIDLRAGDKKWRWWVPVSELAGNPLRNTYYPESATAEASTTDA